MGARRVFPALLVVGSPWCRLDAVTCVNLPAENHYYSESTGCLKMALSGHALVVA
jgi:hypothetical protein